MARYSVLMQRTASTSLSVGGIQCPGFGQRRIKLYDWMFGSEAAPADNAFLWQVQRSTTAGTSTSVTPQPLDPADAAAVSIAGTNFTVDPTLTSGQLPLSVPLNQRASFRWVSAPGSEIVVPASANYGLAFRTPTSSAVAVTATALIDEQ